MQIHETEIMRPKNPSSVLLNFELTISIEPGFNFEQVRDAVVETLTGKTGKSGLFSSEEFGPGDPLRRVQLAAAIQTVPGVHSLEKIRIRSRDELDWHILEDAEYFVAANVSILVEDNLLALESGSITVRASD